MNKKFLAIGFGITLATIMGTYAQLSTSTNMVGGDRDSHGCIGSAGYVWSASANNCVRSWENTGSYEDLKEVNRDLRLGNKNDQVKILQDFLVRKGYLNDSSTGYFGPATAKAVIKFQKDKKMQSPGRVGAATRKAINQEIRDLKEMRREIKDSRSTSTASTTHSDLKHTNDVKAKMLSWNGVALASTSDFTFKIEKDNLSIKVCNNMFGNYKVVDGVITSTLMSTMMYCNATNTMAIESAVSNAFASGVTITKDASNLTLKSKDGLNTFVFSIIPRD